MSTPDSPRGTTLLDLSRHPLCTLLLSSILIPCFLGWYSRDQARKEARRQIAMEVLNFGVTTHQSLQAMVENLESFHRTMLLAEPTEASLRAEQAKLRDATASQNLLFKTTLWTVPGQLSARLTTSELLSENQATLVQQTFENYMSRVWSVYNNTLQWMQESCLSAKYTPNGSTQVWALGNMVREEINQLKATESFELTQAATCIRTGAEPSRSPNSPPARGEKQFSGGQRLSALPRRL